MAEFYLRTFVLFMIIDGKYYTGNVKISNQSILMETSFSSINLLVICVQNTY